ncbi:MAG: hypothetical protein CUN55_17410, partial [Phototrophicales bacterium]
MQLLVLKDLLALIRQKNRIKTFCVVHDWLSKILRHLPLFVVRNFDEEIVSYLFHIVGVLATHNITVYHMKLIFSLFRCGDANNIAMLTSNLINATLTSQANDGTTTPSTPMPAMSAYDHYQLIAKRFKSHYWRNIFSLLQRIWNENHSPNHYYFFSGKNACIDYVKANQINSTSNHTLKWPNKGYSFFTWLSID